MSRSHASVISLVIGCTAIAGAIAATTTLGFSGEAEPARAPDAVIAKRERALDRFEASLRRALAKKPPALPPVPTYPAVSIPPSPAPAPPEAPPAAQQAPAPEKVVYRRPPPIVQYEQPTVASTPTAGYEDDEFEGHDDDGEEEEEG